MKKVMMVILISVIIGICIFTGIQVINSNKQNEPNKQISNESENEGNNNVENAKDVVIIKNGKIENEDLIDEYMEKVSKNDNSQEITLTIHDYIDDINYNEKKVTYYQGNINQEGQADKTVNVTIPKPDDLDQFGYYIFTSNGNEEKFQKMKWEMKRQTENNQVNLIFYSSLIDIAEIPIVCTYNLESSNYKKEIDMNFSQRKDMGAYKIVDKNTSKEYDFDIYTVGGNVSFTVEGDMVYEFEKALNEKVVTISNILEQAKMDEKYGICEAGMYSDGGTIEYMYGEYTIIKYNTLDGNKDFVVGFRGDIRNQVDEILYGK